MERIARNVYFVKIKGKNAMQANCIRIVPRKKIRAKKCVGANGRNANNLPKAISHTGNKDASMRARCDHEEVRKDPDVAAMKKQRCQTCTRQNQPRRTPGGWNYWQKPHAKYRQSQSATQIRQFRKHTPGCR